MLRASGSPGAEGSRCKRASEECAREDVDHVAPRVAGQENNPGLIRSRCADTAYLVGQCTPPGSLTREDAEIEQPRPGAGDQRGHVALPTAVAPITPFGALSKAS